MGIKRFILNTLMRINRSRQKSGTSIYKTRKNIRLFGKVINFLCRTPKDVRIRMISNNGIYGMKLTPARNGSRVILYIYGGAFIVDLEPIAKLSKQPNLTGCNLFEKTQ